MPNEFWSHLHTNNERFVSVKLCLHFVCLSNQHILQQRFEIFFWLWDVQLLASLGIIFQFTAREFDGIQNWFMCEWGGEYLKWIGRTTTMTMFFIRKNVCMTFVTIAFSGNSHTMHEFRTTMRQYILHIPFNSMCSKKNAITHFIQYTAIRIRFIHIAFLYIETWFRMALVIKNKPIAQITDIYSQSSAFL